MQRLLVLIIIGVILVVGVGAFILTTTQDQGEFETGIGGGPENVENQDNEQDIALVQRANMHRLLQEHAITASLHLQALYDNNDTTGTAANLEENTNDFVSLMNEISNNGSVQELESNWAEHIDLYEQYTVAVREGNIQEAEQIQNELFMHSQEFGRVVNDLLPNVSTNQATDAMTEHVNLTLAVVDAHAQDDDSEKIEASAQASAQAAGFAETLVPDRED